METPLSFCRPEEWSSECEWPYVQKVCTKYDISVDDPLNYRYTKNIGVLYEPILKIVG